ncbi:hypothetical protein cypCar_00013282 [Cyprinus carpio]|nr:hypothetical protein cypCar_00013282 [Cyprinus carpio]
MARLSEHGIRLSSMSPSYLESNSTSHTWPFSAVAELIDNASDPGVTAKNIWIDVVTVREQLCLSFMDNGSGMTPNKLHKMLSFGFTEKGSSKSSHQPIGVYGNGFKSGSMRLGRDALIFTKNGGCQSVGMLSQSFLQAIKAQAVIVPIAPFNQQTNILLFSRNTGLSTQDAYLSILYLKPRIQIILRQKKVQTKLIAKSLSMIENDVYKPQFISSGQRSGVGVIGVIECNFLKPAHNKQDFEYTKEYREHATIKRRGRSLEMSKSPVRPLCRGLSEPASESKQDEVTVTMTTDTQDTDEDEVSVVVTEEEESSPSPRKRRKETTSDTEKGNKSPNHAESPDVPSEGETETPDKAHEGSETNSSTSPAVDTVAQEDTIQLEATVLEGPIEPQTSQGPQMPKDQPRIPPHPLSPHSSTTMAQTVVVTPLSRPGFQPVSPLPADGSDRAALAHRLAQLEREAKRLKRILGIREPEVAMVMEAEGGGPSDVTTGDSVSCDQNAERLNPMSNESRTEELSVCQKSEEQANRLPSSSSPIQQEAETSPRDELYWSKTLAKLQSENQRLLTDLNELRTERDQLLNQVRQTERDTEDRRDQSTNTPNHTYNSWFGFILTAPIHCRGSIGKQVM